MAPSLQHLLGETQVAVKSVQDCQPRLPQTAGQGRKLPQQAFGESRFTGFAVEVAHHRDGQTRPQVQAHRRPRTQDSRLQAAQRLEQPVNVLDRLAVSAKNFEPGPTVRQRVHGQDLRQNRVEPLGAFLEQGLAEGQGQVPELVVGRGDRDRQSPVPAPA